VVQLVQERLKAQPKVFYSDRMRKLEETFDWAALKGKEII